MVGSPGLCDGPVPQAGRCPTKGAYVIIGFCYGTAVLSSFVRESKTRMRLALIIGTLAFVLGAGVVDANGRATLIAEREQGPYRIDISILPGAPVVANTHVSVLVRSATDERVVTDATVGVSAVGPPESTPLESIPAVNDVVPQFYEANLPFDLEGDWSVTFQVQSDLGEESVSIPMYVNPPGSSINWILLAALGVAILTVGAWTWDRVAGRSRGGSRG